MHIGMRKECPLQQDQLLRSACSFPARFGLTKVCFPQFRPKSDGRFPPISPVTTLGGMSASELRPGCSKLGPLLMVQGIEAPGTVRSCQENLAVTFGLDDSHSCCLPRCEGNDRPVSASNRNVQMVRQSPTLAPEWFGARRMDATYRGCAFRNSMKGGEHGKA